MRHIIRGGVVGRKISDLPVSAFYVRNGAEHDHIFSQAEGKAANRKMKSIPY